MYYYYPGFSYAFSNVPMRHQGRVNATVFDYKTGDVNGDQVPDQIYLIGNKRSPGESNFIENIQLVIQDGRTGRRYSVSFKNNAGYNPTLFLGDFTGDHILDIFVSIDSGGSGGFTYNYLYSFVHNKAKKLYDNEWFENTYGSNIDVEYEDDYKVKITNHSLDKQYIMDISGKGEEYLSDLYTPEGKLKKETQGSALGVNAVFPIDLENDGIYELWVLQRIIGLYGADTLGFLQTPMKWNQSKSEFEPVYQWFAVYGTEI